MSFLRKIIGSPNQRILNKLQSTVIEINSLEKKFEAFSNEQLKSQTEKFKEFVRSSKDCHKSLDEILPEAFACVREAAKRTIHQRHFDVQLIGGIVLHQGKIAEMKTGEGKTLAATLPVYLNALTGQGVHIVTVNDYLARRDTNWMGPIYHLLGLSVGCINHEKAYLFDPAIKPDSNEVTIEMENLKEVPRAVAYQADILYGTNNEFGFDYLRDNMVQDISQIVQRQLNFAIIDEVDSILIDEARTPLIISMPDVESTKMYEQFARIVPRLKENVDYNIDEKMRTATLTEEGIAKVENILGVGNIYDEKGIRYVHHLEQALRAEVLFKRDRDYVVKNGEVIIVDEFTGRLMPGRRYSGGLHQALEAKEGVKVQQESRTLASITFQNYFRMYKKLAGMTGTALTSAEEFHKVYGLDVVVVPTNKPMIRVDLPDAIFKTENGKFKAIVREIKQRHQKGQPVLVGTVSIEKNEYLGQLLRREGIPHQILNAKYHEKEAQIIAQAGRLGAVTVATNMAGRGVDIILGGRCDETRDKKECEEEHRKVIELGGLHIIGTERHEARRIDDQLRGRAGRQGDPGSSQFFVSLEDDLMRIFGSERIQRMMNVLNFPEDQPIENKMISRAIESAQARIEGYNFDIRKHVLEYDDVLNKQREVIYRKRKEILESVTEFAKASNIKKSYRQEKDDNKEDLKNSLADKGQIGLREKILLMINDEIGKIVDFHTQGEHIDNWQPEEIFESVSSIFFLPDKVHQEIIDIVRQKIPLADIRQKLKEYLFNLAQKSYKDRERKIGAENMRQIEKFIFLRNLDMLWMNHLEDMESLRDSVRLRAYGQLDPLVEYKNEGHRLFQKLLDSIQSAVVSTIYKVNLSPVVQPTEKSKEIKTDFKQDILEQTSKTASKPAPVGVAGIKKKKIGRNDPCPCGSGKKYKHCCGA